LLPSRGFISVGATLFDGVSPRTDETRYYSSIELGGIR
jgi:hypothetical protein